MEPVLDVTSMLDNGSYFPVEVIATLMESDSQHEYAKTWTSAGNMTSRFSPLKTILRFSSHRSPSKNKLQGAKKLPSPYNIVNPSSIQIDGNGSFFTDGISVGDQECSKAFFNRFIREFVDDAILGEDRTIVTLGSSGQGASHPFFMKDDGLVHLALQRIHVGQSDDIWKLLTTITGATVGVSFVQVMGDCVSDMFQVSRPGQSPLVKGWKTSEASVNKGNITGAEVVNSSDPEYVWKEILLAVERSKVPQASKWWKQPNHKILQINVKPTGGRLTFIDLCKPDEDIQTTQEELVADATAGWPFVKQTVEGLTSEKPKVPFSDAKLNRLMCEILTGQGSVGNARTLLVLCANPKPTCVNQTITTITTALRAREILLKCHEAKAAQRLAAQKEKDRLLKQIQAKDELISELQAKNSEITALLQHNLEDPQLVLGMQQPPMPFSCRSSWPVPEIARKPNVLSFATGSEHSRIPDASINRGGLLPDLVDGLSDIGFGTASKFRSRQSLEPKEGFGGGGHCDRQSCEQCGEFEVEGVEGTSNRDWADTSFKMNFTLSGDDDRWPEVVDMSYDSDKLPEPFLESAGAQSDSMAKQPLAKAKQVNKRCVQCISNGKKDQEEACPHSGVMPTGICCFNGMFRKHSVTCT